MALGLAIFAPQARCYIRRVNTSTQLIFDPMDPDYARDPHPVLARFRAEAPVMFWERGGGYLFFRHEDCHALMRDKRLGHDPTFGAGLSPEMKAAFPEFCALQEPGLLMAGEKDHARMRRLLNPIFVPRALEVHRPKVTSIIERIIDSLPSHGTIDVMEDFASKYPVRVIAGVLNIPGSREDDFVRFADAAIATIFPGLPPEVFASHMPSLSRGMALVKECIAERRARMIDNDLLSQLIHACDADERLSDAELLSLVAGLIIGGSDTTVHLTTYAILNLHEAPTELARLRADPSLARGALEETLRYNALGRGPLPRFVTETFTHEGTTLERGKPAYLMLMSAFRDSAFIPSPDTFDIGRVFASSPWFGFGPHFCLGASLARMEAEIALQAFFARYPSTELDGEPTYGNHPILRDITHLPLRVRSAQ
jgi:cytochrome P450